MSRSSRASIGPCIAVSIAAPHLVPVVARELELGARRHLQLGQRDEVIEPRLAGDLLAKEPAELLQRRLVREPVEQRIVLTGAILLELLEPRDELRGIFRRLLRATRDLGARTLEERLLEHAALDLAGHRVRPVDVIDAWLEPRLVEAQKLRMQRGVIEGITGYLRHAARPNEQRSHHTNK